MGFWRLKIPGEDPKFRASDKLARYIHPEFRRANGNRPKLGAYLKSENEKYLSVNSLEIETINQVADTYAKKFETGQRPVAIAAPTVSDYNDAAHVADIEITFNSTKKIWEYNYQGSRAAYKHYRADNNISHCGVEYVEKFNKYQNFKYSRRMAMKDTYGLF